jgi:hypothetical protein
MSERRACAVIGADRTSIRRRSRRPDAHDLRERLRALASARSPIAAPLVRARWAPVRLPAASRAAEAGGPCREPQKDPAALPRGRAVRAQAAVAEEGDRITGSAADGGGAQCALVGRFRPRPVRPGPPASDLQRRALRAIGSSTMARGDVARECLAAVVDASISGRSVARELTALIARRGKPGLIVSDHDTEFTSNAMLARSEETGVPWHLIASHCPAGSCKAWSREGASRCRTGSARPSVRRCGTNS